MANTRGRANYPTVPHMSREFMYGKTAPDPTEVWLRLEEIRWVEYAVRVARCNESELADTYRGATDELEDKLYEALRKCEKLNKARVKNPRPRKVLVEFEYDEIKWTEYASKTVLYDNPELSDDFPGATEQLDERLYLAMRQIESGYGRRKYRQRDKPETHA